MSYLSAFRRAVLFLRCPRSLDRIFAPEETSDRRDIERRRKREKSQNLYSLQDALSLCVFNTFFKLKILMNIDHTFTEGHYFMLKSILRPTNDSHLKDKKIMN
jgi:hypothetical protein